jgi:hypothetical protein
LFKVIVMKQELSGTWNLYVTYNAQDSRVKNLNHGKRKMTLFIDTVNNKADTNSDSREVMRRDLTIWQNQ